MDKFCILSFLKKISVTIVSPVLSSVICYRFIGFFVSAQWLLQSRSLPLPHIFIASTFSLNNIFISWLRVLSTRRQLLKLYRLKEMYQSEILTTGTQTICVCVCVCVCVCEAGRLSVSLFFSHVYTASPYLDQIWHECGGSSRGRLRYFAQPGFLGSDGDGLTSNNRFRFIDTVRWSSVSGIPYSSYGSGLTSYDWLHFLPTNFGSDMYERCI
jgi:hypothetical protein